MPIVFDVRRATLDDLDDLLRLNKALFDYEYDEGFTETANRDWTYSDNGRSVFRSYVEKENSAAWIAANETGDAVGYLAAVVNNKSYNNPPTTAEIENMFIDEKYRCSGIGRTLVEQFKEWSAEKGAGLLTVSAWVGNKHARDFYERWGFSEASVSYEMKC